MSDYYLLSPELRQAIARSRRMARKLEREGRVREAHRLDRNTSFVAGWVVGGMQAEARAENAKVAT
jgi:hypothetical protein